MNIVIKAGSASLTQFSPNLSYYLEDITAYHEDNITPSLTFVSTQGFKYPCVLSEIINGAQGTFKGYSISPTAAMPEDDYTLEIALENTVVTVASIIHLKVKPDSSEPMFDEHNCLLVSGRTIQVVADQVQLLAEDENSQEIRFKIRNRYDGVHFLAEDQGGERIKDVEIDFIPAEWEQIKESFIESDDFDPDIFDPESEYIADRLEPDMIKQDPQNSDYMFIHWIVPYAATQRAGALKIAIAISESGSSYVWQTGVATLTVQPNIGRRNKGSIVNMESVTTKIENRLDALESIFSGEEDSPVVKVQGGGVE